MAELNSDGSVHGILPLDILMEVLLWVPSKSLMRFKCVSKCWCSLIMDPTFVEMYETRSLVRERGVILVLPPPDRYQGTTPHSWNRHFFLIDLKKSMETRARIHNPTSIPYTTDSVSNMVNGVICFYHHKAHKAHMIYLYNLSTLETLPIPLIEHNVDHRSVRTCYLGFDPIKKEFKVVLLMWKAQDDVNGLDCCEIFTVSAKDTKWKSINISSVNTDSRFSRAGFCLGGVIYWTTYFGSPKKPAIIAFDVRHELPDLIRYPQQNVPATATLAHLRGQISLLDVKLLRGGTANIEITVWRLIDRMHNDRVLWKQEVVNCSFVSFAGAHVRCNHLGQVYFLRCLASNLCIIDIYDVATGKYMELKLNNSQSFLSPYSEFRPSKVFENIRPLKITRQ